jgi:hypothetical protein
VERRLHGGQIRSDGDLRASITLWLSSQALSELVNLFGGPSERLRGDREVTGWLDRLDSFSNIWDYRLGQERDVAGATELSPIVEAAVIDAVDRLGFCESVRPSRTSFDHVVVLGGLIRSCILRTRFAAHLFNKGMIESPELTILGGHRPLSADELVVAATGGLGENVEDEFFALDAATRLSFELSDPILVHGRRSELVGGTWSVNTYRNATGQRIRVAAAPSSEPATRRATTSDTCNWFAENLVTLQPKQTVLIVTTPIYVPWQHTAALRILHVPYDVQVETVGFDRETASDLQQTFTASHYLQEVRSMIHELKALWSNL